VADEAPTATGELNSILQRLRDSHDALIKAIEKAKPEDFERPTESEDTTKRILERTADDVNFYYGRLVAQAVSLPQPPYMEHADFGSFDEATASIQEAHHRFTNLLHDLTEEDLARKTRLETTSELTLRQVLETAAAHYKLRADQMRTVTARRRKKA
jgi:cellobiose-specific phosphotransferase system component IIA